MLWTKASKEPHRLSTDKISQSMKKLLPFLTLFFIGLCSTNVLAQDDLLDLLGEEEETTEYVNASFKTTRVINVQSLESTAGGVLDLKISHRFGRLNTGGYELWGLDAATMRIGLDYGINDWIMVGAGRNSFQKTYDAFIKVKPLRQSVGKKNVPLSVLWYSGITASTLRRTDVDLDFKHRLVYTHQLIVGSKLSKATSIQVIPTFVHRNLVTTRAESNNVMILGVAGRQKLTKRIAINAEYFYILPDQVADNISNSLSIGFDIETGGHVFQLHFTNSTSMSDKGFLTETTGKWLDGDIHFGFNISRVFTVRKPKKK